MTPASKATAMRPNIVFVLADKIDGSVYIEDAMSLPAMVTTVLRPGGSCSTRATSI